MVHLEQFDEKERDHLLNLPCPTYDTTPFTVTEPFMVRCVVFGGSLTKDSRKC